LQSKKFDSEAKYIRKYIPKLTDVDLEEIHDPIKYSLDYAPLSIDHSKAQAETREIYKKSSIDFEKQKNSQ